MEDGTYFFFGHQLSSIEYFTLSHSSWLTHHLCLSPSDTLSLKDHIMIPHLFNIQRLNSCKNGNSPFKIFDIFLIFAQNIEYGYTLQPTIYVLKQNKTRVGSMVLLTLT